MALLDLQAMQPSAPQHGDGAGSTSSTGCAGAGSDLSVLICLGASSLSLTACH
jgi:hypothetical protein